MGYLANAHSSAIHTRAPVGPVKVLGGVAGGMSEASDFFDSEVCAPMKELARSAGDMFRMWEVEFGAWNPTGAEARAE